MRSNGGSCAKQLFAENADLFAPFGKFDEKPNRGGGKLLRPISKLD
jgi:hypothetical protein